MLNTISADRVLVDTEPGGASVFLNGEYKGKTPITLEAINFGKYQLDLKKKDFEYISKPIFINQKQISINQKLRNAGLLKLRDCPEAAIVNVYGDEYNYEIKGNEEVYLAQGEWKLTN